MGGRFAESFEKGLLGVLEPALPDESDPLAERSGLARGLSQESREQEDQGPSSEKTARATL